MYEKWDIKKIKMPFSLAAAPRLYQKTCHILWNSNMGVDMFIFFECRSGNNGRQLPFLPCFPLHLFPPMIHLLKSWASLIKRILWVNPLPAQEALLGFVCRLGGNLMTAEEPLKWPLVFNRENATSAVIILDLCQEPLDRRRYCSASSHFDRLCRCSCPCRHVKSCQHPQRSLLLLLALARHRHERGWIIHEWENT